MSDALLSTARLLLRWFDLEDVDAFYELGTNREVIRYVGNAPFDSRDAARRMLLAAPLSDYATYGYGRLACVWKETGRVIGACGVKFLPEQREPELGYRFLPEFWGMGLATEAAHACVEYARSELRLKRLIGLVHPENVASARVMRKLDFHVERKTEVASMPGVDLELYALEI
jgi:RimJ/RimL family protein N-acetyltransferase